MLKSFIDIERIIHSVKTAIACLIGFLITKIVGIPAGQWIVITIVIVMCAQIYVGSVVQKGYLRFLGTLTGCLFATIALLTAGDSTLAVASALVLSSFIFSYVATRGEDLTYAGTLGAATTVIILLGQNPTFLYAAERFFEISLGILIATLVSQFVLPIHARTHLRRTQAATLGRLRDYYSICIVNYANTEATSYQDLDENIVNALLKQRQLAKEAGREPFGVSYDKESVILTLQLEKEILRAMDFMHHAISNLKNTSILSQSLNLHGFNDTILQALTTLIKVLEMDDASKEHIHIPSLTPFKEEIQNNLSMPSREELIYIDGFLFSAELLTNSLAKLGRLYRVTLIDASQKK